MSLTRPCTLKISEIIKWNDQLHTFFVSYPNFSSNFKLGQFAMIWVPGVDEFPLGISHIDPLGFTVELVGSGTANLFEKNVGDYIGVRGPFGNGFFIPPETEIFFVVTGGHGFAPLRPLVYALLREDKPIFLFHGAKSENLLLYFQEFRSLAEEEKNLDYQVATDDGSCGEHCFITKTFERVIREMKESNKIKSQPSVTIFGVGPELMLKTIYDFSLTQFTSPKIQMSLADRYMKCGIGICGSCNVDNGKLGIRLCKEGPVFNEAQLSQISTFGRFGRDAKGQLFEF
ncbi:MAG: hypothetical protein ACFFBD_22050 [Candidatus Hodarchaeota archaeon]